MNKLYFGDNLDILREHINDESVDLIYLDPPFNSNANYNVLFKTPKGHESAAQIEAFEDTWHWNEQAEREFGELVRCGNTDVSEMMQALRRFLGENDMMAYLTMMANRLLELHRVLKPTGSLYLHCDPTASHYLKIVLDGVFGVENFQNEVIWKRTGAHGGAKRWGPIHDVIHFYSKSNNFLWNKTYEAYDEKYVDDFYRFEDEKGKFRLVTLTGAGTRTGDSGKPWRNVDPTTSGRHWAVPITILQELAPDTNLTSMSTQEKLDLLDSLGAIAWPQKGLVPQYKRYLDPDKGNTIQDIISDIQPLSTHAAERLGYPTQKPLALLERIIQASSNEGDVVLDPFCGCGTAVHAAQKLKRQWLGIDITHLAVSLIEKRMKDAFPGIVFEVEGTPKDLEGAQNLALRDKYQFQWWACSLVGAQPYQGKKKGGDNVNVAMVRDLAHVVEREKAEIGLFVTLAEATRPMREEAVKTGFYESPITGAAFPKVQILTIAGLMEGHERAHYPDLSAGGVTFKKAKVEEKTTEQKGLF